MLCPLYEKYILQLPVARVEAARNHADKHRIHDKLNLTQSFSMATTCF